MIEAIIPDVAVALKLSRAGPPRILPLAVEVVGLGDLEVDQFHPGVCSSSLFGLRLLRAQLGELCWHPFFGLCDGSLCLLA